MEDMIGLLSTIKDQSHENFNNKRIPDIQIIVRLLE